VQVGTISANGEREIGELIARAMEKVGSHSHTNAWCCCQLLLVLS
jgi:chaperonin GroEL (HSP60 family)